MARIPTATYRLQLHANFGFDAASQIADYLHHLGISHVYCSPYLQAAPGSNHGYDVVDHHKVNEELGGSEAYDKFCKHLGECDLGQVLDIVPNHMAISGRRNRLWWDVLENGPSSRYAPYFDIDWNVPDETIRNKTLAPILGDHYGRVLSRHEIEVERKGGEFVIKYFENEFPAAPKSLPLILAEAAAKSGSDYLAFLSHSLDLLPRPTDTDQVRLTQRHRDKELIRVLLGRLFNEVPFIADAVDAVLKELNGNIDRLDHFLERQNFRLAFWRAAEQDLVYRRFFDVNTLVGLHMESPQVFADTHAVILNWLHEGVLDGIRVDHPDGLRDPREYFERLRKASPDVWILGEKILEPGEKLRREWPINGTTGYDYLNEVSALFVDSTKEAELNRIYEQFTGASTDYVAVCRDKKHRVLRDLLGSDVNRLTTLLLDICKVHRNQRDFTRHDVIRAIRELVACFPVYRTYVVPERNEIIADDEHYVNEAIEAAKGHRPEIDADLFDFMRDILLLRVRGSSETEFVMRFQQFTGPAMAKGVEDTVFYNYNRLISLNEVGGDPGRFGISLEGFHKYCAETQSSFPTTMLGSSTHDTKRSEDVRARLNLLSEIPDQWEGVLKRWGEMNAGLKMNEAPDPNTEYFLYQTLIGAWPIDIERLLPYMEKATREAKSQTNWLSPNKAFEEGTKGFIESLYKSGRFGRDLEAFVQPLIEPGRINSLSQLLLKLTSPGIPDTYQGCELWDLSLVDPDNRRPVDYGKRRQLLRELPSLSAQQVWDRCNEGLPKLWTTYHTLQLRRKHPECFGPEADYVPIFAEGSKAEHLVGYRRGKAVMVLVPRLVMKLAGNWDDTTVMVPVGIWRNQLTNLVVSGGKQRLQDIFDRFPVALLTRE
ncbi:MAG: malto-oligosyltrehalose synthase [Acidobacteriaceae bacterium]|nr:malto-oligosyltrehalose synthase [Acidobacteriaceae bacterium]